MAWEGDLAVVVTNQTGGTITEAHCQHTWDDKKQQIGPRDLDDNGTMELTVRSGSGGSDEWSITFWSRGVNYYRKNKQCNITEGDLNSGRAIYINLLGPSTGWSIEMPDSSSCLNNYYDTMFGADAEKSDKPRESVRELAGA
jgi:hypothetical protein